MSLNLTAKDILDFLTATVVYALRKKQLKDNHQSTTYVYFQFYNSKLCSEKYFVLSVNSTVLIQIALEKKQMIDFLVEQFDENAI